MCSISYQQASESMRGNILCILLRLFLQPPITQYIHTHTRRRRHHHLKPGPSASISSPPNYKPTNVTLSPDFTRFQVQTAKQNKGPFCVCLLCIPSRRPDARNNKKEEEGGNQPWTSPGPIQPDKIYKMHKYAPFLPSQ